MNWFRTRRRYFVAIAVLAIGSLAVLRYSCPWPLEVSSVSATALSAASSTPADKICGPEGCTYADSSHSASDQTLPLNAPARLLVAAIFAVVGLILLVRFRMPHSHGFHYLRVYPFILEFYRLRI